MLLTSQSQQAPQPPPLLPPPLPPPAYCLQLTGSAPSPSKRHFSQLLHFKLHPLPLSSSPQYFFKEGSILTVPLPTTHSLLPTLLKLKRAEKARKWKNAFCISACSTALDISACPSSEGLPPWFFSCYRNHVDLPTVREPDTPLNDTLALSAYTFPVTLHQQTQLSEFLQGGKQEEKDSV